MQSSATCAQVVRRKLRSKLEAAANEKVLASGRPLEPQIVSEPRWKSNQKLDPYKVRPGAFKMVLPPEEEAKLQLVRASPSAAQRFFLHMWHNAGSCAHLARELVLALVICGVSDLPEEEATQQLVRALPHPHTVTSSACVSGMACAGG